jgi:hypothetical protein
VFLLRNLGKIPGRGYKEQKSFISSMFYLGKVLRRRRRSSKQFNKNII